MTPRPLTKFRAYPEKGASLYFTVWVWGCAKDMRKHLGGTGQGCCLTWTHINYEGEPGNRKAELGEVHLAKPWFSVDVVCHECQHAILSWAEQKRLLAREMSEQKEERIAYAIGELSRRIYDRLYEIQVIKR